jgi:5,10-methylenetetrahydrofolate reductase
MRFADKLAAGELAVTLEITPPRKRLDEVLLRRARFLGSHADAVNVIQRSGRLGSLDASLTLRGAGLEPVWHLVSRGRTRAEIDSEIASAANGGLDAALCVRGDHPAPDADDTPKLREIVAAVCHAIPNVFIGATANQYGPHRRVLSNLLPKLAAGARFVQTQPVLDPDALRPLVQAIRSDAPTTWIVPMVMPLTSPDEAERIAQRLGIPVPPQLAARLSRHEAAAGWEAFEETVTVLVREGLADGLAIMTPQMDPPPEAAERIAEILARAVG